MVRYTTHDFLQLQEGGIKNENKIKESGCNIDATPGRSPGRRAGKGTHYSHSQVDSRAAPPPGHTLILSLAQSYTFHMA